MTPEKSEPEGPGSVEPACMEPSEEPEYPTETCLQDPLRALVAGDPAPFEDFVLVQTPLFLAYFRRLGARPADAEDLTQDVMLRLYRNANSYQGRGRLEAFAFRVARNAWIDHCRRASHRPKQGWPNDEESVSPWEPAASAPGPVEEAASQESQDHLFALIAGLGETQREAFRMGVCEERPYSEIAEALGIPIGTVKSRVYHAVQKLRARLSGESPGSSLDLSAKRDSANSTGSTGSQGNTSSSAKPGGPKRV